jgi:hypothetical protein
VITTVSPGLMRTGSHFNALFKGRHEAEFAWFSIIDSLPVSSIDARRAARKIIEACRRGDPSLVVSVQAKALAFLSSVFPDRTAQALKIMSRLLPGPTDRPAGDRAKTGRESQSSLAPSVLTHLSDRAAAETNG